MCGHCGLAPAKARTLCGSCLEYERRTGERPGRAVLHRRFRLKVERQLEREAWGA
jgi:hypothetical protein